MTRISPFVLLSAALLVVGCGEAPGINGDDTPDGGPGPDTGNPDAGFPNGADDCPPMYRQDILPTYELTLAPNEWAAMQDEFLHRAEREAAGLNPKPYHPAAFRYVAGDQRIDVPQVMVRLKGASSWAQTVMFDPNPKMQFVISFNELSPDGRFMGVRKLELDMPRTDWTFLRHRLALRALRGFGIPAQCANSARVVINGQYYGLYTNLERFDKEFLQRNFGHDADNGDLWYGGRIPETNEAQPNWDRLDALWMVQSTEELDELADLDASMYEWAGEMMVGDVDGYGNGFANFYIYDHPTRGFLWLPVDLDTSFDPDFLPASSSPVFAPSPWRWELDWYHYMVVMSERPGFERFVEALGQVRTKFDVATLQRDLDTWNAQIAEAAESDPHRPFTMASHAQSTSISRRYIADRAAAIDTWLACRRGEGAVDRDGDGYDLCHDCDDTKGEVHPDATESCNMRDDNCNGRLDDMAPGAVCN